MSGTVHGAVKISRLLYGNKQRKNDGSNEGKRNMTFSSFGELGSVGTPD
jgi:hypothetical protein